MSMNNNRQHGGIMVFALVAVVLVGLMLGGLYLSKQQARVARGATPSGGTITFDDQPYQSAAGNTKEESSTNQQQPAASSSNTGPVAVTGPSETIPASGPTETFIVLVAMTITVFALMHFLRSQRVLLQTALRQ